MGLDFRMSELQGAVLLAQFRKLTQIRERLHTHKRLFKSVLGDLPGLEFRELTDADGESATVITAIFPTAQIAQRVARDLKGKLLAESGWHVYSNMEPLLEKRLPIDRGCPFNCPTTYDQPIKYYAGMLPQTDDLLGRAFNIGIGMTDKSLATWGLTVRSTPEEVESKAMEFRNAAAKYL
jgi:8-amino-3,8-dideoxy-alpha-D-manno-octulosonate transaminase